MDQPEQVMPFYSTNSFLDLRGNVMIKSPTTDEIYLSEQFENGWAHVWPFVLKHRLLLVLQHFDI